MIPRKTIPCAALAALALASAAWAGEAGENQPAQVAAAETDPIAAEVLSAMDRSADPCHDFYRYACGGWLDETELPGDQTRWVRSFSVIADENREELRDVLEDAAADPGTDPDRRRIGWYYASCMDLDAIEKAGTKPLQPILDEIARVENAEGALAVAGKLHRWDAGPLFGFGVLPDFKNPGTNIAFMIQGGLGMPDRDYYVSDDEDKKRLLAAYLEHVARVFGMLGASPEAAAADAERVVDFETALARASRPRQDLRLPEKIYNKLDRKGLEELTPSLPWGAYFTALGAPGVTQINVATPEFFTALAERVAASEPADLRAYLPGTRSTASRTRCPSASSRPASTSSA